MSYTSKSKKIKALDLTDKALEEIFNEATIPWNELIVVEKDNFRKLILQHNREVSRRGYSFLLSDSKFEKNKLKAPKSTSTLKKIFQITFEGMFLILRDLQK